jgi:Tol biopolymer transport system component
VLVYMTSTVASSRTTLTWVDRNGLVQPISDPQQWGTGRLSPDGRRVANGVGGSGDIWIYEIARRTMTRLTFQGTSGSVNWTPDGKRVAFRTTYYGKPGLYWMPADGTGKPELLVESEDMLYPSSWSPDGKTLVYEEIGTDKKPHLWMLPVTAGGAAGKPVPLRDNSPSGENIGQVSPDGKWIAFVSTESGRREIYVQPFPGPGPKVRISTNGGDAPRWAHSGREIFYWEGEVPVRLMSVALPAGPSPNPGPPQKLFDLPAGSTFDVAPDDNHFLVESISDSGDRSATMNVIDNWFEELRRHTK